MRLYPEVTVKGQSFVGVKKHVVPDQSMTLQQIIKRFIKKEALPISREGTYEDGYDYDLEKIAHEDFTVKDEILTDIRAQVKDLDAKVKKQDVEKKDAMKKAADENRAKLLEELKSLNLQTANADKA